MPQLLRFIPEGGALVEVTSLGMEEEVRPAPVQYVTVTGTAGFQPAID
jgi:hypothetical protein